MIIKGEKVLKEYKELMEGRLERLKVVSDAFKDGIKNFSIEETDLDNKVKPDEVSPDLEELRFDAMLEIITERK